MLQLTLFGGVLKSPVGSYVCGFGSCTARFMTAQALQSHRRHKHPGTSILAPGGGGPALAVEPRPALAVEPAPDGGHAGPDSPAPAAAPFSGRRGAPKRQGKRCYNGQVKAQDKHRLALRWAGAAWKALHTDQYKKMREHCWVSTGCLLTADGSQDAAVKPEGMSEWAPPGTTRCGRRHHVEATAAMVSTSAKKAEQHTQTQHKVRKNTK